MSTWIDEATELQKKLDRTDVDIGHSFEDDFMALGNGDNGDLPLLASVGVDRLGRLWRVHGRTYTLMSLSIEQWSR